jgi:hypothetical protein
VLAFFILPDFPDTSFGWLTPAERALAQKRMAEDVSGVDDSESSNYIVEGRGGSLAGLMLALTDWKVWWLALALMSFVISLSFNAFFPTLSQTMGYGTTVTLLLCVPPWIFATVMALAVSRCHYYFVVVDETGPDSILLF